MSSGFPVSAPIIVEDPAVLQQVGRLRILAWEADGELPSFAPRAEVWIDEHDSHAVNWVILCDGLPIAAARLCVHKRISELPDIASLIGYEDSLVPPVAAFTRLVVSPAFRGRGLSKELDGMRLAAAQEEGCRSAVVVTHVPARMRQLRAAGFRNLGESHHRTVTFAPSCVFSRDIGGVEMVPEGGDTWL
ncbi:GNAT superfamily N-acetyltransferase [Granulicella aggregans]|uniref:GNAT superfamily N-acetyltransferase n=2 Tax=Granulicella aggregans TaxID=474949 RepID=A0A7W8E880_9BACT|nr:GNAT family N-acetyltransferase [Granulicella aggregans]MBB5061010.1 GNAT superfamily N-acetyltransferase [Granulicella aggregans]